MGEIEPRPLHTDATPDRPQAKPVPSRWRSRLLRARGPAKRAAVPVLIAAVVAGVLSSPSTSPNPSPPTVEPVAAAPDAATAVMAAARQGSPVEVLSERTATRTVLAHPDGRHTAKLTAVPTRFQRGDQWVPIDRDLAFRPDGTVAPKAVGDDVAFSGGGATPLLRLARGADRLALRWPAELPKPVLSGTSATYRDVFPGVDLVMRAELQGYQQLLVIKNAAAARNPALARLALGVDTAGITLSADESGGLRAVDQAGQLVYSSAPSMMWDAGESRKAQVRVEIAGNVLTLVPDQAFLTDPATAYPVTVDPKVDPFFKTAWATTLSGKPGNTYWNRSADPVHPDWAQVGQCYPHGGECNAIGEAWAFFQFETGFLADKQVLWAKFYTETAHSPNCNAYTHLLNYFHYGLAGNINWNNKPVGSGLSWKEFTAPPGPACAGHKNVEVDVSTVLNRGGTTSFSMQAREPAQELAWRKYYSGNTWLEVQWNRAPNNPTDPHTDPPLPQPCRWCAGVPYIGDASIRLIATLSDPDGDEVRGMWRAQVQDRPLWSKDVEDFKPSGVSHDWVLNLNEEHGRSVNWWVHGADRATGGGATHGKAFAVDRVGVTTTPGVASAAYPDDNEWHGGVGVPGSFTFSPGRACDAQNTGGVCDIDHYRYGWSTPPSPESKVDADALGGSGTVTIAPPGDGPRTLYVQSVDRAGHASPIKEHRVHVRAGSGAYAQWSMDGNVNDTAFLGDRHGTAHGNVTFAPGAVGSAMVSDGAAGTYVSAPNTVRTDAGFSVSSWVKLNQADNARRTILRQDGTNTPGFELRYDGAGKAWVMDFPQEDSTRPDQERYVARSNVEPVAGTWTHVAATYDAASKQITLYVNGVSAGTAVRKVAWRAGGETRIGQNWAGSIDEVAVYDRVLTPAEINAAVRSGNVQTGYWRFDEKDGTTAVNSAEGGDAAVLHGDAKFTSGGAVNRAVQLDGDGDYAATGKPAVRTDMSFSVAAWVKADQFVTGGKAMTAVSQDGSRHSGFYLQYNSEHKKWIFLKFVEDSDTMPPVAWIAAQAKQEPVAGAWTHLAGTFNAADRKMTIYVDGQYGGEAVLPAAPWHANGPLTVGRAKFAGNNVDHWQGGVDEVRAYSRVLSPAELEGIVNRSDVSAGSWKLNGNVDDDGPAGKHGVANGSPAWTAGQASIPDPADMALQLDGNDDYVRTAPVVDTTKSYSVSAWVRLAERQSGWHAVATHVGAKAPAFTMGYFGSDNNPPHRWVAQVNGPDQLNPKATRVVSDVQAQPGVWTHLTSVYRAGSGELILYVNGVQAGYAKLADQPTFKADAGFEIGRGMWNGSFGEYFRGAIDDVKVHSRPLNAEEIQVMAGRDPALVHHWRLDEGSGTTAADAVGSRPATLANGAAYAPGRAGNSLRFDGADDEAYTNGVDLRTDGAFTVSAWVNLDKPGPCSGTCSMTAASVDGGTASNTSKFRLGHRIDTDQAPDGKWVFEMPERDGSVTEAAISAQASQFNTWVHLVGVYDVRAGQIWLYVLTGGEDVDIDDGTLSVPWNADAGALRIGRGQRGGSPANHWRGNVDDVRLYAVGLSEDRITALHRSYAASAASQELPAARGGHWKFDESGAVAEDSSGRDLDATMTGGSSRVPWRQGQAGKFDGSTGFAETATPAVNTSGSFSASAWAYVARDSVNHQTVLAQDGPTQSAFLVQYQPSSRRWTFEITVAGQPSIVLWSAASSGIQLWTHVAVTYDATLRQARLYLNGVVSAVQVGLSIADAPGKFTIGRGKRGGNNVDFLDGSIDDVRAFDKALTDGEVRRVHDDVPIDNQGTWSFEGNTTDSSPRALPTTVSGTTRYEPGIRGQALWLDGSTGAATTQQAGANLLDSFTVSAWAKLTTTGKNATVVGQDGNRMSGFVLQYNKNVGRWIFGAAKQDADLEPLVYAHSPAAPELNIWTHLTGVYDYAARELRLYVNGDLVDVQEDVPLWPATGAFTIGRGKVDGAPADHFTGLIDEVRTDLGVVSAADIAQRAGQPAPAGGQLARFVNPAGERATANSRGGFTEPFDPVPPDYRFDRPLGRLLPAEQPDTRLLTTCRSGTDEFTSTDPTCGGATKVAELGWAYTTAPPGLPTVPLYRCVTGTDRFDSLDSTCEGGTQQEVLGHTLAYAPLVTYRHTQDDERTTTTLTGTRGYRFDGVLGLVLLTEQSGTSQLWSCRKGLDGFLTTDSTCGGETQVGPAGRVWTDPLPGSSGKPLYLCQTTRGERFNSTEPTCAATGTPPAVLLGHVLTVNPGIKSEGA